MAEWFLQVTVLLTAVQSQGLPVGRVPSVKDAASKVSTTVSPWLPSGSPVGPGPLLVTLTKKLAPLCCPCWKLPLGNRPVWPLVALTVTGFSMKFMHQPPPALLPVPCVFWSKYRLQVPSGLVPVKIPPPVSGLYAPVLKVKLP